MKLYIFFENESRLVLAKKPVDWARFPQGAFREAGEVNVEPHDPPLYGASSAEVLEEVQKFGHYLFPQRPGKSFYDLPESVRRMARSK